MNTVIRLHTAAALAAFQILALAANPLPSGDPLPSWNDTATKSNILTFVSRVVQRDSPDYLEPAARVAVFDNDGTLWSEQPAYTQFLFGMDRMRLLQNKHTELLKKEPFKSAAAGDMEGVVASGVHGLIDLTAGTHGGLTQEEFDAIALDWLRKSRHPKFQKPFHECVYQPMIELIAHLRAHGFKTYIVSGGALEFMRPWTEKAYGIPPEQVIGSTVKTTLETRNDKPVVVRLPEIELINDKAEKVLSINRVIGRRPVMAFGNSDGDLPMLQWTAQGSGPSFCAYVHHTDGDREYAYDRQAKTGKLDKGLDEARSRGWTVINMKQDWKKVFPFQN